MPQHDIQMHCFNAEVFCTKLFRLFSPLIHYAVFLVHQKMCLNSFLLKKQLCYISFDFLLDIYTGILRNYTGNIRCLHCKHKNAI